MEVGVRELRNNLSRYLERVRDGEEVVVTDRGRAIARVSPIGVERVLDRLIADGVVTPATLNEAASWCAHQDARAPCPTWSPTSGGDRLL